MVFLASKLFIVIIIYPKSSVITLTPWSKIAMFSWKIRNLSTLNFKMMTILIISKLKRNLDFLVDKIHMIELLRNSENFSLLQHSDKCFCVLRKLLVWLKFAAWKSIQEN